MTAQVGVGFAMVLSGVYALLLFAKAVGVWAVSKIRASGEPMTADEQTGVQAVVTTLVMVALLVIGMLIFGFTS